MAQRRVAETGNQQRGVGLEIGAFRHGKRRRLLLHHQGESRFAIGRVGHGIGDGFIAAEIAKIRQEGVAAVEHPQLHHFKRHDVFNKLRADFIPRRAAADEAIFNHPLAERFAGDGARIVDPKLVGNLLQRFRRRRGYDAVNHGAREGGMGFNPCRQQRVARLGQAKHRHFRHVAILADVIAGHHRKGLKPLLTAQAQRFDDITYGGFRRLRVGEVVLNQRVVEIELAAGRIGAVAFFSDRQGDDCRVRTRHGAQNAVTAVDFRMQCLFHRTDNFQRGAVSAFFRHRVEQLLIFQLFNQNAVVARHQVDFADAPVAVAGFQQMMGIKRLMCAVKCAAAQVNDAGFQARTIPCGARHRQVAVGNGCSHSKLQSGPQKAAEEVKAGRRPRQSGISG